MTNEEWMAQHSEKAFVFHYGKGIDEDTTQNTIALARKKTSGFSIRRPPRTKTWYSKTERVEVYRWLVEMYGHLSFIKDGYDGGQWDRIQAKYVLMSSQNAIK